MINSSEQQDYPYNQQDYPYNQQNYPYNQQNTPQKPFAILQPITRLKHKSVVYPAIKHLFWTYLIGSYVAMLIYLLSMSSPQIERSKIRFRPFRQGVSLCAYFASQITQILGFSSMLSMLFPIGGHILKSCTQVYETYTLSDQLLRLEAARKRMFFYTLFAPISLPFCLWNGFPKV